MLNFRLAAWLLTTLMSVSLTALATPDLPTDDTTELQQTGYIKDDLFIYMHAGAGKRFRIVGSVNAGTPIEKMEEDQESGYIKIKDDKGRIGWIDVDNYSEQPSVRNQLLELQGQFQKLRSENKQMIIAKDNAVEALDSARQQANDFSITAAKMEQEKTQLQQQFQQLGNDKEHKILLYGAGIFFGGILVGLIFPSLIPRRRRKDNWM